MSAEAGKTLQRLAEIPVQEIKRIGEKRAEALAAKLRALGVDPEA